MKKYIAVAGTIGSGKSALIDFLCKSYPLLSVPNPAADNPYLEDFFRDMKRWAFHSQIYFLSRKFEAFKNFSTSFSSIITCRTIYEDAEIFARNRYQSGLMSETDFMTYYQLYLCLSDSLPAPDLLIYLHSPVSSSLRRLNANPKLGSVPITEKYLRHLNRLYVNWIADYDLSEVIIIDTEQHDFTSNLVDRADILEAIERYI